jgi:hypothetical protein
MTKQLRGSNALQLVLIEEWSQDRASSSTPCASLTESKKVSFSKYSTSRVYITDPYYEGQKSYSSADQKIFRREATEEAFRIHHLISSYPGSTGFAIRQLMEDGLLVREELLGIEHLVSMTAEQSFHKRRSYTKFVLGVQKVMRETSENKVNVDVLAAVAIMKSARMIEKARLRAALAF